MIVLDCNAAIAMIRNTPEGKALRTLLLDNEKVYAPRFFCVQTAQTVSKYVRANLAEHEEAGIFFSSAINLVDDFYDDEDLIEEAIAESIRLDHSVYDLLYFVLARRHMATLFTIDKKLQELCLDNGVNCVFLETPVSPHKHTDNLQKKIHPEQNNQMHDLYLACKKAFRFRPDAQLLEGAFDSEESDFYVAVADFFLQHRQKELIDKKIF